MKKNIELFKGQKPKEEGGNIKKCLAITKERKRCQNPPAKRSLFCYKHRWWWLVPLSTIGALLVTVTTVAANLTTIRGAPFKATRTSTPTLTLTATSTLTLAPSSTVTLTPSATIPPPESASEYYMIVLDASDSMKEAFDGRSKWDAALESLNIILEGLNPHSHYGLVVVGGSRSSGPADLCGKPSAPAMSFSSKENLQAQIGKLQVMGGGSFFNGYVLAKRLLEDLPSNTVKTLIYITGSSDACESRNEWGDLEKLLSLPNAPGLYSEIIILDENGFNSRTIAQQINSLSEKVKVQAPKDNQELRDTTNPTVVDHVTDYVNSEKEAIATEVSSGQGQVIPPTPRPTDTPLIPSPTPVIPTQTVVVPKSPTAITYAQTTVVQSSPTPVPPTLAPPQPTSTYGPLTWIALTAQPDVFSTNCFLLNDARVYAQFSQAQAGITATLVSGGHTGRGLRLDFTNASYDGGDYAGWEVWLGADDFSGINLSSYSSLVFYVRGSAGGEEPNVYLMMPITNDYQRFWKDVELVTPVTNSWKKVIIPLSDFTLGQDQNQQVVLTSIQRIQILFEWYTQPTSGRIFIDDLCVQ